MKMKKMLLGAFLGMFALAGFAVLPNYASAQEAGQTPNTDGTNGGRQFSQGATTDFNGSYEGWAAQDTQYNAGVAGSKDLQSDSLISTIRTAINWVLGMLSLIALCLCLWGGFQMMTSGGDQKKYENGLNILKWAAIGLAVIALSWLIVSLIFYVINGSIGTNQMNNAQGNGSYGEQL